MNAPAQGTRWTVAVRPLRPADAEGVAALYGACAAVEPDMPRVTPANWAKDLARPQFGFGRDFRVAEAGGETVGLVTSTLRDQGARRDRHLRILVHPAHRRSGIGTALLRTALDQGPAEGDMRLGTLVPSDWDAGLAFARHFGFVQIESESKMRCAALRPVPDAPPDVSIARAADARSLAARVAEIHDAAFADDAGFTPMTAEDTRQMLDDMELWTASVAGAAVGYALIEPDSQGGFLETLAVVPDQRGRGIGAALAFRALEPLRLGGERTADLGVSSMNPGARRIYERLGFVLRHDVGRYATTRDALLARLKG